METQQDALVSLQKLVQNEALIETTPSLEGLNHHAIEKKGGAIYYGTGLSTSKELSIALPFDVLSMVFIAEKVRRTLGMDGVIHFIADTHAKSNNLFSDEMVDQRARETKEQLEKVFKNLGLDTFKIIFASDFDTTSEYRSIYESFDTDKHDYIKREVADIEWLRKYKDLRLKVGWIIQSTETKLGFDERVFDREYKDKIGDNISFVYLKSGRTFDKSRPKASPYIHIPSETRLLLKPDEDVVAKLEGARKIWGDKNVGGTIGYFADIIRVYEKLFGSLGNLTLEDKIQKVISKATA